MSHHHVKNDFPFCRNCHYPVATHDKFCPNCGQKATDGKTSMHDLVHEFVHSWLHVDGKFFTTAAHLFVPGKLTVEFFKGRHKRYAHPIQLFFMLTVISLAATTWLFKGASATMKAKNEALKSIAISKQYKAELETLLDSATRARPVLRTWADSLLTQTDTIFNRKMDEKIRKAEEKDDKSVKMTADFGKGFRIGYNSKKAQDTAKNTLNLSDETKSNLLAKKDSAVQNPNDYMTFGKTKFNKNDLLILSDDELVQKYNLNTFLRKAGLLTVAHFMQRGGDFIGFFMSKMLWISVVTIPIAAWFLMFLYRRQKRFYVEHIVFMLHWLALFAAMSIFSSVLTKYGFSAAGNLLVYVGTYLYLLFAMSNFYQQDGGKTFLKFLIFTIFYTVTSVICVIIGALVSAILF